MFPRHRWSDFDRIVVYGQGQDELPTAQIIIQKDQFGNIRKTKITS